MQAELAQAGFGGSRQSWLVSARRWEPSSWVLGGIKEAWKGPKHGSPTSPGPTKARIAEAG